MKLSQYHQKLLKKWTKETNRILDQLDAHPDGTELTPFLCSIVSVGPALIENLIHFEDYETALILVDELKKVVMCEIGLNEKKKMLMDFQKPN